VENGIENTQLKYFVVSEEPSSSPNFCHSHLAPVMALFVVSLIKTLRAWWYDKGAFSKSSRPFIISSWIITKSSSASHIRVPYSIHIPYKLVCNKTSSKQF